MKTIENSEHDQPITVCDWKDVAARLALVDRPENIVYGVPPGGMIAAGFLAVATNVADPADANTILIDVIREPEDLDAIERRFPDLTVKALFDQTSTDRNRGWLVMPWEEQEPAKQPTRGKSGLTEEEWAVRSCLESAIDGALALDWPNPATLESFYSHAYTALALLQSRPVERALLES
ncbi:MAG: hypothetical protein EOM10_11730 [Opitutae bacterium]|nr:hypothetical protein [Opitutae bacterium]